MPHIFTCTRAHVTHRLSTTVTLVLGLLHRPSLWSLTLAPPTSGCHPSLALCSILPAVSAPRSYTLYTCALILLNVHIHVGHSKGPNIGFKIIVLILTY